jgi:hypothetical protein
MTVRVRDILKEIEALSAEERKELELSLHGGPAQGTGPKYLSREEAAPLIKEMLTDHSELFRKLAQ